MDALRHGNFRLATLLSVIVFGLAVAGCDGDDGNDGNDGADGAAGLACWDLNENGVKDLPDEDLNGDGVVDVNDCNPNTGGGPGIAIGDGSELTEEEIEELGQLVATIDDVEVSSPPVVTFTVTDSNGNPANGIAEGVVLGMCPCGNKQNRDILSVEAGMIRCPVALPGGADLGSGRLRDRQQAGRQAGLDPGSQRAPHSSARHT